MNVFHFPCTCWQSQAVCQQKGWVYINRSKQRWSQQNPHFAWFLGGVLFWSEIEL